MNVIFRKAGKRSKKEININKILEDVTDIEVYSELLKLHKSKGRPKTIYNDWIFATICEEKKTDLKEIIKYSEPTRKEILGEFYGKEYVEKESWQRLWEEIERKKIQNYYGR